MLIRLLLTFILVLPSMAYAQISAGERARAYYMDASTAYETKDYERALESLESAVDALGSSNARIAALQVKSYIGLNDYASARIALNDFYRYPANEQLKNEMGRYLIMVEKEEEVKRAGRKELQRLAEVRPAIYVTLMELLKSIKTIPAGSYTMGCSEGDTECDDDEKPRQVSIQSFKLMESEVTFAMWDACVAAGGCSHNPPADGWGRGNRPVINVSYDDITQQFIPWLNNITGQTFRLPSEAEWEYAARAGTNTMYHWGNTIDCNKARYGRRSRGECSNSEDGTVAVKSFSPNAYGLYDMHGNVWERTADCWNGSYNNAPSNGSAWTQGDCSSRVLRGGSWFDSPRYLRASNRHRNRPADRNNYFGVRLAQD